MGMHMSNIYIHSVGNQIPDKNKRRRHQKERRHGFRHVTRETIRSG
jgi:hypothetical protein